jgi:response regulator RpfG family c-di-GMP phosphodiesterase
LHDLGLIDGVDEGRHPDATPEAKERYKQHPLKSVNLVKERRMIVSKDVETAILTHHERYDGKGFPRGLEGDRFPIEGQILSFADQVAYALTESKGRANLKQIVEKVLTNGSIGPEVASAARKLFA